MKSVVKIIVIIGLLIGALYLYNDQRKKIEATKKEFDPKRAHGYSLEELRHRRNRIIRNIEEVK